MTEEIKFEKAMERLEKIVEDLEAGNLSLDEALKRYEEGIRLSRTCQKKLGEAEKKIEILTRSLDGSLKREPFDAQAAAENAEEKPLRVKKPAKSVSKESRAEDDDLLF